MTKKFPALLLASVTFAGSLKSAVLEPSDGDPSDFFGRSVSIFDTMALVGAPGTATGAYLFRDLNTASGTITEDAKLVASDVSAGDSFGSSVSVSGTTAVVGARRDDIGSSSDQGSAYVFRGLDTATGTVTENAKLVASDGSGNSLFGNSVSLLGSTALVGAEGRASSFGGAYVFRGLDTATGTNTENLRLTPSDGAIGNTFGASVSLGAQTGTNVNLALVGSPNNLGARGAAYVFVGVNSNTGTVTQNVKLIASDAASGDNLGVSVSLRGNTALVGAPDDTIGANMFQGSAYLFTTVNLTLTGTNTESAKLVASDGAASDRFGSSVSISRTTLDLGLVGAPGDDIGANADQGSVYAYVGLTNSGTLIQTLKITASDGAAGSGFGRSVSLNGGNFVIAAEGQGPAGKAYSGNLAAMTTGLMNNSSHIIDGISFESWTNWVIGTNGSSVTLRAGSVATVTNTGMRVEIGAGPGQSNNVLTVEGTLNANEIRIGDTRTEGTALVAAGQINATQITVFGRTNGVGVNRLLVTQSDRVADTANITLTGGTIERGAGVSETFGNLNLTRASFLDFGTGAAGTLRFGTYTPSFLLTVRNFRAGNSLVFGSDLSGSITNTSLFSFDRAFTYDWNAGTSTFTILTAIPEPSTVVAAVGLLALLAGGAWRRRTKPQDGTRRSCGR